MRTNIILDDTLVQEAMAMTHAHSKKEVVHLALRELVARRKQPRLVALQGQDLIDPDYDIEAVRARMAEAREHGPR